MDTEVGTGRSIVLAIISVGLLLEVTVGLVAGSDPTALVVRVLLLGVLGIFAYQCAAWARWVMGIGFGVVGLGLLLMTTLASSPALAVWSLCCGVIYMVLAYLLLFSPSVKAYYR